MAVTLESKRMIDYYTTYDMASKLYEYRELYKRAQAITNHRLDQVKHELEEIMKENHYPKETVKRKKAGKSVAHKISARSRVAKL